LDGDYYKSKWAESGVMEADCLVCHLKGYDHEARNKQIKGLNFRWAATVGAGFGRVTGAVANGQVPKLTYDLSIFGKDGKVTLPVVKEVPNENCLSCHHGSDWKKRGQSYSHRTDVHIRAGLRCIDCHLTGRHAQDPRIKGREEHQIGKGDDPGNFVRDDLDNTMRCCEDCHEKGILNAPIIKHRGLPPEHLKKIACQTCHIPWRQVKAALVQDASVFNTSPRIAPAPKRLWSFYGPDIKPWNFYGDEIGYPEGLQPFFRFRPVLGWYKGEIYPLNRVYTLWVGIKRPGETGIRQPRMKDIFSMWKKHLSDPDKNYPLLKKIQDDNRDGFKEVNTPEEIMALLESARSMLRSRSKNPAPGKVVFVDGDRYTADGVTWETLSKKPYEYTPYGSVFKFSHDITPARNAWGAGGCKDCHGKQSDFFSKDVMAKPFDGSGKPVIVKNASFLGFSSTALQFMTFEHETLKPVGLWSLVVVMVLLMLHYVIFGPKRASVVPDDSDVVRFNTAERLAHYGLLVLFFAQAVTGLMAFSALPFSSDALGDLNMLHRYTGYLFIVDVLLVVAIWARDAVFERWDWQWLKRLGGYFGYSEDLPSGRFNAGQKVFLWLLLLLVVGLAATGLLLVFSGDSNLRLIAHGVHEVAAFIAMLIVIVHVYLGVLANPGTLRGIFEGRVTRAWVKKHHPLWKPGETGGSER